MIEVDLRDLVPHRVFGLLSVNMVELVLDQVADGGRAKWISLAGRGLGSTAQTYIKGIQEIESSPGERSISLVGWLANALENGMSAWDMHTTMFGGPGTKYNADGQRYVTVPFRHGTPGSTGLAGTPMGMAHGPGGPRSGGSLTNDAAKEFGRGLYEIAKKLKSKTKKKAAGTMTASDARDAFHAAGGKGEALLRSHHSTSIYTNMQRKRASYSGPLQEGKKRAGHTQYMTWRTISESNPEGWRHPGFEARNFADQVSAYIGRITPGLVRQAMMAMQDPK